MARKPSISNDTALRQALIELKGSAQSLSQSNFEKWISSDSMSKNHPEYLAKLMFGIPQEALQEPNIDRFCEILDHYNTQPQHSQAFSPAPAPSPQITDYLNHVRQQCDQLPLSILDVAYEGEEESVKLLDIYVELKILAIARKDTPEPCEKDFDSKPISVLAALKHQHRLVLLGQAGSGKTTLTGYLTQLLCVNHHTLDNYPHLKGLVPIRIVLRQLVACTAFNRAQNPADHTLIWLAFKELLGDRYQQAADSLQAMASHSPMVWIFDGLDEVPEGADKRDRLIKAVRSFLSYYESVDHIILMTARPYAYAQAHWTLPGLPTSELLGFDQGQIEGFIDHWYQHSTGLKQQDQTIMMRQAQALKQAIQTHAHLQELAQRPLLLTLIAILHSHKGRLPDNRADLYERSVDLLLQNWQKPKIIETSKEPGIDVYLNMAGQDIRRALEKIAYWGQSQKHHPDKPANIPRIQVRDAFYEVFNQLNPNKLFYFLEHRAGLLLSQGEMAYTFPHRSFQEYLAACYLSEGDELFECLIADPKWWREVFMLGVARKQNVVDVLNALYETLHYEIMNHETDAGQTLKGYGPIVVAQALLALGPDANNARNQRRYKKLLKPLQASLQALLVEPGLAAKDRAEAGQALGQLGDPRKGVGLNRQGQVEIDWVVIDGGAFQMARYPVTQGQYRVFVAEGGYQDKQWWCHEGWDWFRKERIQGPKHYGFPFHLDNHPVVGVSWYEAKAYCRWLSWKWSTTIYLPSEAQWEYAARGIDGRVYPWGSSEPDAERANYDDNIGSTSAVGIYPLGQSTTGLMDMVGNVWQWCEGMLRDDYQDALRDGSAWLKNPTLINSGEKKNHISRVLRGGSWVNFPAILRACGRNSVLPTGRGNGVGFRLAQDL